MRAVVQRVSEASVTVDGRVTGRVEGAGLLVLLGVTHDDDAADAEALAGKVWNLRIMRDERSAADLGAGVLVVSQFTLYADVRKGRRPSWGAAAPGAVSEPLYEEFCAALERLGAGVERGVFGADMAVASVNDGPVTLVIDTENLSRSGTSHGPIFVDEAE